MIRPLVYTLTLTLAGLMPAGVFASDDTAAEKPAGTVRLGDLFSIPAEEESSIVLPQSLDEFDPTLLGDVLDELRRRQLKGDHEAVLTTTAFLLSALPRGTDEYIDTMSIRAESFEALGKKDELLDVSRRFLREFPEHDRAGWFMIRVGRELAERKSDVEAGRVYELLLARQDALSDKEITEAATALLRVGKGKAARGFLARLNELETSEYTKLLMAESLLVEEDRSYSVPAAKPDSHPLLRLRIGLLQEIRGERAAARQMLSSIDSEDSRLSDDERKLLRQRMTMLNRSLLKGAVATL